MFFPQIVPLCNQGALHLNVRHAIGSSMLLSNLPTSFHINQRGCGQTWQPKVIQHKKGPARMKAVGDMVNQAFRTKLELVSDQTVNQSRVSPNASQIGIVSPLEGIPQMDLSRTDNKQRAAQRFISLGGQRHLPLWNENIPPDVINRRIINPLLCLRAAG